MVFDAVVSDPASSQRVLYFGALALACNEYDLLDLFRIFGTVVSIDLNRRQPTRESLMCGVVEFETHAMARAALERLNSLKYMGRYLRLYWASDAPATLEENENYHQWSHIQVSFDLSIETDFLINEEILDCFFSQFGTVADVHLKRSVVRQYAAPNVSYDLQQSGYGFVYFYDRQAAILAACTIGQQVIDGVTLSCTTDITTASDDIMTHPPLVITGLIEIHRRLVLAGPSHLAALAPPVPIPQPQMIFIPHPQHQQQQQYQMQPVNYIPSGMAVTSVYLQPTVYYPALYQQQQQYYYLPALQQQQAFVPPQQQYYAYSQSQYQQPQQQSTSPSSFLLPPATIFEFAQFEPEDKDDEGEYRRPDPLPLQPLQPRATTNRPPPSSLRGRADRLLRACDIGGEQPCITSSVASSPPPPSDVTSAVAVPPQQQEWESKSP